LSAGAALELELLPSAVYYQRAAEQAFCETFLRNTVSWVEPSKRLFALALSLAGMHGLAALDALHIASALAAGAQEFITTEKPTKPIYRVSKLKITHLLSL
jgi:predicted nucleic acid-binding protein